MPQHISRRQCFSFFVIASEKTLPENFAISGKLNPMPLLYQYVFTGFRTEKIPYTKSTEKMAIEIILDFINLFIKIIVHVISVNNEHLFLLISKKIA